MNTQFDLTEVIFSHIDLVYTKLDQIRSILFQGSSLDSAFSSKPGSDVIDFVKDVEKAKNPKISNSVRKFMTEQGSRVVNVTEATCYCLHWCDNAIKTLKLLYTNSLELDISWNYQFTIRFCQIFVAICKVVLFFSYFKNAHYCVTLCLFIDGGDSNPNLKINGKLIDYSKKISFCTELPFVVLQKDDLKQLSLQLGQLISQIGPFLIQVIGEWPLLDWQDFVVFNRLPKQQVDSILPNLEHIILANLQTLVDTSFFFSFFFPSFISDHPQFLTLMNELLSETDSILVSKATTIPITHIVTTYNTFLEQLKKKNSNVKLNGLDIKIITQKMEIKFSMSHKQRFAHLIVILKDIMNLCECEAAYLPTLTYDVVSLCGFAYYELSVMLAKSNPKNQSTETTFNETSNILQVIDILVRITKVYCKYERHIMRFFVYNIATVDLTYLTKLYQQYSGDSFDWQKRLTSYVGDLCFQIQQNVNLEEFDNGVRYDFTPFIYTQGRVLHYYNFLKIDNHIAYLQTIFEHFETIRTHMMFAQSPIQAFLTYCPIHTLWRSYAKFSEFVKNAPGSIHLISSIINLFSFFNYDKVSMSVLKLDFDNVTNMFTKSRADILNYFYRLINTHLDERSLMMNAIKQNRFDFLFDFKKFVRRSDDINIGEIEKSIEVANDMWQMKELLLRLPDSISFKNSEYPVCSFISQGITDNLGNLLFKRITPEAFSIDSKYSIAAQIVWPIYTMLNSSFSLKLYQSKFDHSNGIKGANLIDNICKFKADDMNYPNSKSPVARTVSADIQFPTILNSFISTLKNFISNEYLDVLYLPYKKSFSNTGNGQYLSQNAFEVLFLNIGLVSVFHIDHFLIQNAAHIIADIFAIYHRKRVDISNLLTDYRKGSTAWQRTDEDQDYQKAGQLMIKLGVVLTLRKMVRIAAEKTINKTIIGFSDLVSASYKRSIDISENKAFLVELTTSIPTFFFIESYLSNAQIEPSSDSMQFFFYFALLLSHSQFKKAEFDSENETLTNNLHLFPVAIDAFLNLLKVFCVSSDSQIIGEGMELFFNMMLQSINRMKSNATLDSKNSFSFIILIDLFPKNISIMEYGRISHSFPTSIISTAYRLLEKQSTDLATKPSTSHTIRSPWKWK